MILDVTKDAKSSLVNDKVRCILFKIYVSLFLFVQTRKTFGFSPLKYSMHDDYINI